MPKEFSVAALALEGLPVPWFHRHCQIRRAKVLKSRDLGTGFSDYQDGASVESQGTLG